MKKLLATLVALAFVLLLPSARLDACGAKECDDCKFGTHHPSDRHTHHDAKKPIEKKAETKPASSERPTPEKAAPAPKTAAN